MAEDKKSFILYCDLIHTIEKMPNDKAGELFKHILEYVNDRNPETEDLIIQLTFEPIKQSLKRDLIKFENTKKERSDSGALGNLKRWNKDLYDKVIKKEITLKESLKIATSRTAIKKVANIAVSDSDSVSVNVTNNKEKFDGYILEIQKHRQFTESWYMQHRVSKGTLQKLLNTFIISLGLKDFKEQPNNLGDFKKHFVNWCNTQDRLGKLTEYKKNKSKVKGAL